MRGASRIEKQPTAEECEGVFRALFDQTSVGMVQVESRTGAFVRFNQRYADIVGYTVAELEGLTFQQITHPEDLNKDLANMQRLLRGEINEFSVEKRYRRKDGSIVWVNLTVSPMWKAGEEPTYHITMVEDITERRHVEKTIREARDYAENLLQTANAIVVVLDTKGEIRVFNDNAEKITGYTSEELRGRNWFDVLVPRERYPEVWAEFERLMTGGLPGEFENPILTKGGEERHIAWKNSELMRDGRIAGTVSFGIDITERKQAEEQLRASGERLGHALQAANMGTWEWDVRNDRVEWSPEMMRIFGIEGKEFGGTYEAYLRFAVPEVREEVDQGVKGFLAQSHETAVIQYDHEIIRGDGMRGWVEVRGTLFLDEQGQPSRMTGVCTDITASKHAQQAIRESEEQLRTVVQTMPVMVDAFDDKQNVIVWNRECERVTGYTAEEIVGNPRAMEMLYPDADYRDWVSRTIRKEEGDFRNLEFTLISKNGEPRTVLWSNLSASHPISGWATWAVGIDITERKLAVEELASTKGMLEAAIARSPSGIVIAEAPNATIRLANEAAFGIRGGDPSVLIGIEVSQHSTHWELLRPDGSPYPPEQLPLSRAVLRGEVTQNEEVIIRDVSGTDHWVSTNAAPIRDESGEISAGIAIFHDVTDRKQVEKEREELIARLEAQNAELERFTYTVSHDLKSPLITIKGYIGMLSEDLLEMDTSAIKSDLSRISRAADKMGDLLDDLLELSRIGRLANPPEDVSLEKLAREALELLQGQLQSRRVQVDIAPDLPVVNGDRMRLLEVLQNLIDNAVKYMGEEGQPRIEIGARRDGNESVCFVRDNGLGIKPRFHDKVFGLFDQLDPTAEGTGIGLALVKRIIEVHGGRIWIESAGEGCGSTFCFTIPDKVLSPEPE